MKSHLVPNSLLAHNIFYEAQTVHYQEPQINHVVLLNTPISNRVPRIIFKIKRNCEILCVFWGFFLSKTEGMGNVNIITRVNFV